MRCVFAEVCNSTSHLARHTPEIAEIVHRSIVQDITALNKKAEQKVSYKGRALLSIGIDEMEEQVALAALS